MKESLTEHPSDRQLEITALLRTLAETRRRLEELGAEEVLRCDLDQGSLSTLYVEISERRQAEEALAASEVLLRQFIQHTPAAIAMLDTDMCYLQASARWLQDYKLVGQDIIGQSHYDIFPETPDRWKAIHARVLAGATERSEEDHFLRADGSTDWLQWEALPWYKSGGAIGGVIFFTQVITARKQAETALQQSEEGFRKTAERLAKVLDSSLDVICTFDAEGRFTQVNAACEAVWGYRPDELLGTFFFDLVHPDDLAKTRAIDTQILSGHPVISFENRYVRKDGSPAYMMWSAWWSDADKSNFCVAHDITEIRKADAATRELAERLALATKAGKLGIWDWNIDTGDILWDTQMHALYGTTPHAAPVDYAFSQQHIHPGDRDRVESAITNALLAEGPAYDTSFRIVVPGSGEIRHIRAQGLVFRDLCGRPTRMLGTTWDTTAQVEREATLRQKLENERHLLRQALVGEKAKSEFLAVMSHEIRTPMNSVLGFAEMLAQSPTLSPEDLELSRTIVSSGEALLRIIDDILDFSRIEAGQLPIQKEVFSPRELIADIHTLFASQIRQKGLEFCISIDDSIPEAILGDAGRIRQILVNLLGNALKFTRQGSITLRVRASAEDSSGSQLTFSVQDTGEGITPDRVDAIFEPFTQADSSISRRHGGTGLGLSISRRLAELMGGALRIALPPEGGTLFTLHLPFTLSDLVTTSLLEGSQALLPIDPEFAICYPQRILVVEDDPVNLKLIIGILRKLGYEPLVAHHGAEAVTLFRQENPTCILMDMQMPEMDGIEATHQIRHLEQSRNGRPHAFISGLTANILHEDQDRCLAAGMNICLNKPIKQQAIAQMLTQAWHHVAAQRDVG